MPIARRENHFIAGLSLDVARSRYEADTEIARLTADRGTVGIGRLDAAAAVRVRSNGHHGGFHVADFFSLSRRITLMGAARYTRSAVHLRDRLGDALTGDHEYARINPSAGLTVELRRSLSIFGSYSEASRVPTPSELSCADPNDPCRLPNAFVSDPPLRQVVARTIESGVRGRTRGFGWSAALFRTRNTDDILFISSGTLTNEGHFENVGDTLRQGLEIMANGPIGSRLRWTGSYTYLRATFETPLTVSSPNHPDAIDGEIFVPAGARLPSIPGNTWKTDLSAVAGRTALDVSLEYNSHQFYRGDEANLLNPIADSFVVGLNGRCLLTKNVALSTHVANVLNAEYSTFGLLGDATNVLGQRFDDTRFASPGAPRAAWAGIDITFP
jgi:outer membrane receptor protein involved in Fe transport